MFRFRPIAIVLGLTLALTLGAVSPLAAHTEVWQRSPAAGQAYGGTIDEIQISFVASVASTEMTMVGPNDEPIEMTELRLESADRVAVAEFAPLTEAGRYLVTHSELAADGDIQTDSFQFFFDPTSSQEVVPLLGQDGPNWPLLGGLAGVILILAGLFWPGRSSRSR